MKSVSRWAGLFALSFAEACAQSAFPQDAAVSVDSRFAVDSTAAGSATDARAPFDARPPSSEFDAGAASPDAAVMMPDVLRFDVPVFSLDVVASDVIAPGDAGDRDVFVREDARASSEASLRPDSSGDDTCALITDRTPTTLYLSSDDSSSVASPVIARMMLRAGRPAPVEIIRTHEFLNYYNPRFAPAPAGTVRLETAMRRTSDAQALSFQVAIQSESRALAAVRPMTITLVLDTSGSMNVDGRMERQRAVARAIASQLRAGDVVNVATWDFTATVALDGRVVSGPNDPVLLSTISGLVAGGGTDLSNGLREGYSLAMRHFRRERLNRVVLVSDGEANVGVTEGTLIGAQSHRAEGEEIYLVGVGVGSGVGDTLMDEVTDLGRGGYIFIDTEAEANVMFRDRFVENMDIAVRAARLELELPWYMRVHTTSAEVISTDPRLVDPQHLAPNDAMVFQQTLRACSATIVSASDEVSVRATYEDRVTHAPREVRERTTVGALLARSNAGLLRAEAVVAYADAVKLLSLAPGSAQLRVAVLRAEEALRLARASAVTADPALDEIASLVAVVRRLARF